MKKIGIAGATGLVGEALLSLLESGPYQIEELRLFASERSAGRKIEFRDQEIEVTPLSVDGFKGLDLAFFCLENELVRRFVPEVAKLCLVIDKSSEFRLRDDVPLVVPEVNPQALSAHKNIIASPNCTTIPLVVALNPLHQEFGLKEIFLATYQSVSGAGRAGVEQLNYESEFFCLQRQPDTDGSPFPVQIVDNVIPWIGGGDESGISGEEKKTILETQKILSLSELKINSTCVRVPVTIGHCLAVTGRFEKAVDLKKAHSVLKDAPGLILKEGDEPLTPLFCRNKNDVFVSRVRRGATEHDLNLWIVADNLYKGAATNALQIAELLFKG